MKRPKPIVSFLAGLELALLLVHDVCAADANVAPSIGPAGTVIGSVFNQVTGDMLEAATVMIEGTAIRATTERGGKFSLAVPAGPRVLIVSYAGLDATRLSVTVPQGETVTLDVPLSSGIYTLDKFTVTGLREGEARSTELQRRAENMKTIVASDAFGTAEASSPGGILMRIPGIAGHEYSGDGVWVRGLDKEFVSMEVDGNSLAMAYQSLGRGVNLNFSVSMDNIESVEFIRAPTPDMASDSVAGKINLITRRGVDRPGRHIDLTAGTQWTDIVYNDTPFRDRPELDFVNFNYSDTYSILGKKNNLSVLFNASRRNFALLVDHPGGLLGASAQAAYIIPTEANQLTSPLRRSVGSNYNWVYRPLYGNALNIDFKASERTYLYFKNTLNFNAPGLDNEPLPANLSQATFTGTAPNLFEPGSTYELQRALPVAASVSRLQTVRSDLRFKTYAGSAGLEHKLADGSGVLTVDASYSMTLHWRPFQSSAQAEVTGIGWELDRRGQDPWIPKFTQTAGPSIYDPASYMATAVNLANVRSPSDVGSFRLDFKKTIDLNIPAYIKTGVRLARSSRELNRDEELYTYSGPRGIGPFTQFNFKTARGHYGPFPFLTVPGTGGPSDLTDLPVNRHLLTQTAANAYNSVSNSFANDAKFEEEIDAGYVMGGVTLGILRMMGGVRVETTKNEATGYRRMTSVAAGTTSITTLPPAQNAARALKQFENGTTTTEGKYRNVFPGIHFILEPWRKTQLRATYNLSITRPAIGSLLPISTINDDNQVITTGNPDLKPYTSDNFEVAVQKYFEPAGLVEANVFLKEISNYTRSIDTVVPGGSDNGFDGQYTGYTLRQTQNIGDARIRGFELSYKQQYTFLPGFMRGSGAFANYSYTQAEGSFGGATFTRQLPNLRPRVANLGLSWVGYGAELRVIGNWMGGWYITGAGPTQVYNDDTYKFDFKAQYRVGRNLTLYLDIVNFTNEATNAQMRLGTLPYYIKWQGAIYAAGAKWKF